MKKKVKSKRLLPLVFAIPAAAVFPLSSCGLIQKWDWNISTKNNTEINYCLLIGQNDHPDSIERTRYTRVALDTYDEEATKKLNNNANLAKPKQGFLPYAEGKTEGFKVTELEHMEQKSMAGATWDPITANSTAAAWTAKHGTNITCFVSNNDSMAEAAVWAGNWIQGMPIFGYDANSSTIKMIKQGIITGTVDQNASTQCSTAMMMLRNMLDDKNDSSHTRGYGTEEYIPIDEVHFAKDDGKKRDEEKYNASPYGYVSTYYHTANTDVTIKSARQVLAKSTAIAHVKSDRGETWKYDNVDDYINESTGEPKQPSDLFDTFTHIKDASGTGIKTYNVCQTYCNRAETYLIATLKPYFNEYAKRLGLNLEVIDGDGTGESVIIDQIKSKPDGKFDAYLINMAKTTATGEYIKAIAEKCVAKEKGSKTLPDNGWDDFKDRLETPVIFYNRQPQTDTGATDINIMNNHFFKYTYFVGVDAPAGGRVQGEMIREIIREMYRVHS